VGAQLAQDRNRVRLPVNLDGKDVSHFRLREFESPSGAVCVQPSVLVSLELLRDDLWQRLSQEVEIIVTSGTRTDEDNERLAAKYGWIEDGGSVSRTSKHLLRNGACAVDIIARIKKVPTFAINRWQREIPLDQLELFAKQRFDWVKAYKTHIHCDNRDGGQKVLRFRSDS
jgi:hypothetical protein